jgi:hypothetical protein
VPRARIRPADAAILAGVPALLVAVYLLPVPVKRSLALSYLDPRPATLYLSHLVHLRPSHLLANVVGYLLVVPTGYLLAAAAGRRRAFRVASLAVLLAVPVALSALNVALPRPRIGYGFSGVVMGFLGLVPVATFWYLDARIGGVSVHHAPALFLLGLAVAAVAAPTGGVGRAVAGIALLASVAYLREAGLSVGALRTLPPGGLELVAVAVVVVVGYPFVAFPADPRVAAGVLNLYAHLLGYALAFIPAYLTPGIGIAPGGLDPT